MPFDLQDFHFIRPLWLLAIVPLLLIVFGLRHIQRQQSGWQGVIANHLYAQLISVQGAQNRKPPLYLLAIGWIIAALALAGPTWERLPQPVYQLHTGKVVILDMTLSMRSTDVTPNRLSRAKFKAIDLVKQAGEGEIGLIAYAGDAFVISPLSSDVQNLTALIPSLTPEIMPTPGSEPEYAIEEAIALLSNSGYQKGEIFWITDGVALSQVAPITQLLSKHDYRLSILGVGTEDGAPIKLANNELLKDGAGAIVVPRFNASPLETLVSKGRGRYIGMQPSDDDIQYLTQQAMLQREAEQQEEQNDNNFGDQWKEMGPYLILLMLPFAAYVFRRGMLVIALCALLPALPKPAYANWWDDLWQRPDQQGMKSFNNNDFAQATNQFNDPMWKGSAAYRNGDFEAAAEQFSLVDTAEGLYNKGNALAKASKIDEAIQAYEAALKKQPNHADAQTNKDLLEQMKQQQEQQQNQEQSQDQNNSDEQNNQDQQDSESQQNQDNQNQQNSQQQDQQNSESDNEQQDQQNQSEQDSSEQESDSQQDDASGESEQNQSEDNKDEQNQENPSQQSQEQQEQSESEAQAAQANQAELTDEEKEKMQQMQTLLRKIPDDPAYLLQRKMLLEKQRRRTQRLPSNTERNW